jgi:hypothetical protein
MAEEKLTAQEWARKNAKARAASLTPKRRKAIAKKAAEARWGKKKAGLKRAKGRKKGGNGKG